MVRSSRYAAAMAGVLICCAAASANAAIVKFNYTATGFQVDDDVIGDGEAGCAIAADRRRSNMNSRRLTMRGAICAPASDSRV